MYIHIYVYTYISSYASFLSCVSCADLRGRARDYSLELLPSPRVSVALYIFIYSHVYTYTYTYTHTHFVVCLLAICVLWVDLRWRARDYSLEFRAAFVTCPFALYIYKYVYMYTYVHTHIYIYIYISWYASLLSVSYVSIYVLSLRCQDVQISYVPIGCLKSQVVFRKRATNHRAHLRKMTYKDKASYESSHPWICVLCVHLLRGGYDE